MLSSYTNAYNLVWNNRNATPPDVIAAMGKDAVKIFELSAGLATYLTSAGATVPTTYPSTWTMTFNDDGTAICVAKS